MTLATLFTAVALTQTVEPPPNFAQRREVRAFIGGPRAAAEQYARASSGWVAAVLPQGGSAYVYFVLDARGGIDAEATDSLRACLPNPANTYDPQLLPLVGDRGVVVRETCLVGAEGTQGAVNVADVWGASWRELPAWEPVPPEASRDAIRTFRGTAEYARIGVVPQPVIEAVALPKSRLHLVVVTVSPLEGVLQKIFVVDAKTGKIDRALTDTLEREVRSELASTCSGRGQFTAVTAENEVTLTAQLSRGEWEEECLAIAWWDEGTRQVLVSGRNVAALMLERQRADRKAARDTAERLWAAGRGADAIAKWEELANNRALDDADGADLCRTLGQAYARHGDSPKARQMLQGCLAYQTNRAEAHLLYARFLESQHDDAPALAHYTHALGGKLEDADRQSAQRAVIALELKVAEHALDQGERRAARVHYAWLAKQALTDPQATAVALGLERCAAPLRTRQAYWSPR